MAASEISGTIFENNSSPSSGRAIIAPSADTVPPLVVLGAKVRIYGKNGRRDLPVEQFLLGPGKTALSNDELVVGVCLPAPPCKTGTFYHKYSIRGDSDIAIVGVAASLTLSGDGTIAAAKLALGAVAPTVFRAIEAEKILVGERFCKELVLEAAEVVRKSCSPITDQRATADYRREMAAVWTRHALFDAFEQIEP
jgi:carbon-monoxide dehydrogenase medium subunit